MGTVTARQRNVLVATRSWRSVVAALSMALLGFWLWGGTASAESESPAGGPVDAEPSAEEVPEVASVFQEAERQTAPDGDDRGSVTPAPVQLRPTPEGPPVVSSPPAQLAPSDAGATSPGTSTKVMAERISSILAPEHAAAPVPPASLHADPTTLTEDGGEREAVDFGPGPVEDTVTDQADAGPVATASEGSAVGEPVKIVPVGALEILAVSAPEFPGRVIDGRSVHLEEKSWQGRTAGLDGGLRTWFGDVARAAIITISSDVPTGSEQSSTGFLLTNAASSSSGAAQGSAEPAAARFLPALGLVSAAAVMARSARGRLRTRTIQGAVAGAGPPVRLPPVRLFPAVGAHGAPAGLTCSPLSLPSLVSIRRPHPASRLREPFTRADRPARDQPGAPQGPAGPEHRPQISLAPCRMFDGEPLSRWQRLHCALSPPPSGSVRHPRRGGPTPGPEQGSGHCAGKHENNHHENKESAHEDKSYFRR